MKNINKIMSLLLAVVVLVSGITVISSSDVKAADTASWQKTAIVSPGAGKLMGAGYIDVKWNNTLGNVKQY